MGQQWVRDALPVTPGLVPAESSVPSHPYAHVHSGPFGTTLGNSCIEGPPKPIGSMESGSLHIPPQSLSALDCSLE